VVIISIFCIHVVVLVYSIIKKFVVADRMLIVEVVIVLVKI